MEGEIEIESMINKINEKAKELLEAERKISEKSGTTDEALLEELRSAKKKLHDSWNSYYELLSLMVKSK